MKRSEVKIQNRWKTEDVYPSDEAWEKAFEDADKEFNLGRFEGKLNDRDSLLEFYRVTDKFSDLIERLYAYASLKHDEDTRVGKYVSYLGKAEMLYSRYCTEISFYDSEMASQSEEYLNSLINDKDFAPYDYQIKLIIKGKEHVPSAEEQKVVSLASQTLGTFYNIFAMIDNADLSFPEIEYNGKTQ
ncbi:MAG: hypothetical protein ACI4MS_01245, partial [Candidatus Coproplasma sp.]